MVEEEYRGIGEVCVENRQVSAYIGSFIYMEAYQA
jgi:hypothetical protein